VGSLSNNDGYLVVNIDDADLASANIAALGSKVFHTLQAQLAQVAIPSDATLKENRKPTSESVLDTRGNERHGDVALDAVNASPRRYLDNHLMKTYKALLGQHIRRGREGGGNRTRARILARRSTS